MLIHEGKVRTWKGAQELGHGVVHLIHSHTFSHIALPLPFRIIVMISLNISFILVRSHVILYIYDILAYFSTPTAVRSVDVVSVTLVRSRFTSAVTRERKNTNVKHLTVTWPSSHEVRLSVM